MADQTPDKVIDIPGKGAIAFPGTMSDAEIETAAAKLYKEANPAHPEPAKEHSWLSRATDWLPTVGGAIGGILGGVPGAAMGGAAGEGLRTTAMHATELPGAVADVARNVVAHPKETILGGLQGMRQGAGNALMAGAGQGLMEGAGQAVVEGARMAAPALMQSAVKPAYKMVEKAVKNVEMPRVVKTLLDEGINVTQGGIGKINSLLSATNDEIKSIIAGSTAKVYPELVADTASGVVTQAGKQVAPMADKAAAEGVVDQFSRVHGGAPNYPMTPMSVQAAQELKQGTYRAIGARAYGETKGAALETEKALARGLKEGIEAAHPEVKGLNAKEGALIEARDAIAKRVAGAANRDPAGIGWIAENPKSFLAFVLSRSPAVKSMLARGLYQSAAHASGIPQNLIRMGVQALVSSQDEEP